jgi:hypothetical protein
MVEIVAESGDFDKFLHDVEIVSVDIFWDFNPHY